MRVAGVRIVTDSACDLPSALAEEHGIEIVPLTIRFGDEELVDRQDLTPKEFWARVASSAVLPETAAPSPGAFESAYRRAAEAGAGGVVCVTLSGKLSATHQSAALAAQAVAGEIPVRVVDSRLVTLAEGMIAVDASELAGAGKSIDEIADAVEARIPLVRTYAALDTLENLKKGGRIGGAQAFFGSMLSIKPIIELRDGAVEPESRQRTRSRSLRYLVDKVRQFPNLERLAVLHGDAPDIDQMLDMLGEVHPREKIVVGDIGAVIGTHSGPRTIGVTFEVPPGP